MVEIGMKLSMSETVTTEKTAAHLGSGTVSVYSTPSMILFMEMVSLTLAAKHLEDNFTTVGTAVNIRHLASTNLGETVNCESEVIEIDRKRIVFKLTVTNAEGKIIGDGTHDRFVVDKSKFA